MTDPLLRLSGTETVLNELSVVLAVVFFRAILSLLAELILIDQLIWDYQHNHHPNYVLESCAAVYICCLLIALCRYLLGMERNQPTALIPLLLIEVITIIMVWFGGMIGGIFMMTEYEHYLTGSALILMTLIVVVMLVSCYNVLAKELANCACRSQQLTSNVEEPNVPMEDVEIV